MTTDNKQEKVVFGIRMKGVVSSPVNIYQGKSKDYYSVSISVLGCDVVELGIEAGEAAHFNKIGEEVTFTAVYKSGRFTFASKE